MKTIIEKNELFDLENIFNGSISHLAAGLKMDQLVKYKGKTFVYKTTSSRMTPVYVLSTDKEWEDNHIKTTMVLFARDELRFYVAYCYYSGRWTEPICVELEEESMSMQTCKETPNEYHKTYTTFTGADMVAVINGKGFGGMQSIKRDVNGDLRGTVKFAATRFEQNVVYPDNSLAVIIYVDECRHSSFEVIELLHLDRFTVEDSIDDLANSKYTTEYSSYHARILQLMTPVTGSLADMSDEDFDDMVKWVHENCPDAYKHRLPEEPLVNNLAYRVYYWALKQQMARG